MYVFIHRVSVFQQCAEYKNEKLPTVRRVPNLTFLKNGVICKKIPGKACALPGIFLHRNNQFVELTFMSFMSSDTKLTVLTPEYSV